MSVITLHYGQCGNQIGETLFSNLYEDLQNHKKESDYYLEARDKWFHTVNGKKLEPRSILIDTENKTLPYHKSVPYKFENIIRTNCGGSANNWAYGYFDSGRLLSEEIMDCVRLEVEKNDYACSFLNILSSSGGTGSGVASFVAQCLRDEFPNYNINNCIILPYMKGEVATQSYNTLLTLSKITSVSDCNLIFENDRLHYNCINSVNIKNVTFDNINYLITQQLAILYQPLTNIPTAHLLRNLTFQPIFKFLQIKTAPLTTQDNQNSFSSLLNLISRQSRFDFQSQNLNPSFHLKHKNLANVLICRGANSSPTEQELKQLKDPKMYVSTLPQNQRFQIYRNCKKIFDFDSCLALVSNNNSICLPLNCILQDSWNLFRYGAYLHHYDKFHVDADYFKDCFNVLYGVLKEYKHL